ncbi:MAG: mevalonate kinase [Gammaproteobacteria bacterium]
MGPWLLSKPLSQPKIQAFAPGSFMFFGEHAVLHGESAVAMPIAQGIQLELEILENNGLELFTASLGALNLSWDQIAAQSQDFNFQSEWRFVVAAITECYVLWQEQEKNRKQRLGINFGLRLKLKSEIPSTWGLGSSAAVVAVVLKALNQINNSAQENLETLWNMGLKAIRKVQGLGSGADLAVSLYGRGILLCKNKVRILEGDLDLLKQARWYLVYSGFKTPTVQVVKQVEQEAKNFPGMDLIHKEIYKTMGLVTEQAVFEIENFKSSPKSGGNRENTEAVSRLSRLVDMQHSLLCALGVGHVKLEAMIQDLKTNAKAKIKILAAKISGSGLGDCLLLWGGDETYLREHYSERLWPLKF